MSSMVSRRPSLRNQSNDAFWMSIRFGSSRTSLMREKDVRARGAATLAVKRYSLPYCEETEIWTGENDGRQREPARVAKRGALPQAKPHGGRGQARIVARKPKKRKICGLKALDVDARTPRARSRRPSRTAVSFVRLFQLDRGARLFELRL